LFLLAAFLLVPWPFFLLALLFFVTRVLETIFNLLNIKISVIFISYRLNFLPKSITIVKRISAVCLLFLSVNVAAGQTLTISAGQTTEISSKGVQTFTIGNKSIISVKHNKSTKKFIIKGLAQGFSELKFWGSNSKSFNIYVISKRGQLDLHVIKENLKTIGLKEVAIIGDRVKATGLIRSLESYKLLSSYSNQNRNKLSLSVKITAELRKNLLSRIYYRFFQNHYDDVKCDINGIEIVCYISPELNDKKMFLTQLKEEFGIVFLSSKQFGHLSNYQVEMRILQIERLDGREVGFGIDQIDVNLSDLIKIGPQLISNSSILKLKSNDYDVSTLSRPRAKTKLNKPLHLKVGSEIPYSVVNRNGQATTSWKFAGLNIKLKITKEDNTLSAKYETNLTRPHVSQDKTMISGNRQSSEVAIEVDRPIELFEIDLKTTDESTNSIPGLSEVPLLKNLFQSKSKVETYKKIVAIMVIRRS
jgi:hypothetical protein